MPEEKLEAPAEPVTKKPEAKKTNALSIACVVLAILLVASVGFIVYAACTGALDFGAKSSISDVKPGSSETNVAEGEDAESNTTTEDDFTAMSLDVKNRIAKGDEAQDDDIYYIYSSYLSLPDDDYGHGTLILDTGKEQSNKAKLYYGKDAYKAFASKSVLKGTQDKDVPNRSYVEIEADAPMTYVGIHSFGQGAYDNSIVAVLNDGHVAILRLTDLFEKGDLKLKTIAGIEKVNHLEFVHIASDTEEHVSGGTVLAFRNDGKYYDLDEYREH